MPPVGDLDSFRGALGVLRLAGLGTEHSQRLITYFPPVAARAVEEVPAPLLADSGDVPQFVADTHRELAPLASPCSVIH